jgi:hypothetical protein
MDKVKRLAKNLLGWVIAVAFGILFAIYGQQLGISAGTWILVAVLFFYVNYSISTLSERVGVAELPTMESMWQHDPITPQHERSEPLDPKSWGVDAHTMTFFEHFERFADVLNDYLKDSPWRLQQVAGTEVGTLGDDSPRPGRRYKVFYGPHEAGRVSLSDGWEYSVEKPEVHVVLELYGARRFNGESILELAGALLDHAAQSEQRGENYDRVRGRMIEAMWQMGHQAVNNADLDVHVTGSPIWYLHKAGLRTPTSA